MTEALNVIFKKSGIKRMLFITYSFNFYWFHNNILPRIRSKCSRDTEILILAKHDDSAYLSQMGIEGDPSGDQFNINQWCEWKENLKIIFFPTAPLFHIKATAVFYEDDFILGLGSSNLTSSGWSHNLETWCWDQKFQAENLLSFLNFLSINNYCDQKLLEPYIREIKKHKGKKAQIPWLIQEKESVLTTLLNYITKTVPKVVKIRIISPYFSKDSNELIMKLKESFPICELEFWYDGSGVHTNSKNLKALNDLKDEFQVSLKNLLSVKKVHRIGKVEVETKFPLHAKVIEFLDSNSEGIRVFGSANATGAAWFGNNIEAISYERFKPKQDFLSLLKNEQNITIEQAKASTFAPIISNSSIQEESFIIVPAILWATYDEKECCLRVGMQLPSKNQIRDFEVFAGYDPKRDTDKSQRGFEEVNILSQRAKKFIEKDTWNMSFDEKFKVLTLTSKEKETPENIAIKLILDNGKTLKAPVIPIQPDFESRTSSGIPKSLNSVLDILEDGQPIVRPIAPTTILDSEDIEDDESDDEEEEDAQAGLTSLATSPEYNHLPESLKIILKLKQKKDSLDKDQVRKQLQLLIRNSKEKEQLLLAKALKQVLTNE